MRRWPQDAKQSLRFLAAARYYLPIHLPSCSDWEEQYRERLHHGEFQLALESLERIGEMHSGYADELQFWKELYFAAQHMALDQHAARYEVKLQQVVGGLQA
ncbi:MAG: hypothetical protein JWQ21_4094 [Herminiimonas sp.]|nr:hypothetical protein [Herminiimonas sp.]